VNVVGGCCGTTPAHTRELARLTAGRTPRVPAATRPPAVSGIEAVYPSEDLRPIIVGERTNVIGSRRFKELIVEEKFEEASEIGRAQVKGGAQVLDVCLANPDRDEASDMERFMDFLTRKVKAPLMIDSTDARVLQAIREEHPVIPKIERWRELTKLAQTYLDAFPALIADDGRLHTTFNQTAATTGRLSSNNPNLQNIPIRTELGREIRACFVAEPGNLLVSADYSQVELRILAHIAHEPALVEIFEKGEDVHTATACRVFGVQPDEIDPGMRSKAKMINYGIVYGLSAWGMADRLDIPQEEADEFIQRYMAGFPAVARFIEETIAQGTEHGYVSTLFGRRRQVPELRSRRWEMRRQGERFAVNMVIQGTAADIMKVAMVRCEDALSEAGLSSRMVLQIHDELLFEGPAEEAEEVRRLACQHMAEAYELHPPLAVEAGIGGDWLSAK